MDIIEKLESENSELKSQLNDLIRERDIQQQETLALIEMLIDKIQELSPKICLNCLGSGKDPVLGRFLSSALCDSCDGSGEFNSSKSNASYLKGTSYKFNNK